MRFVVKTLLLCVLAPRLCLGWGPEGHRIVADIARDHLTATARRGVVRLLGDDDLAAISTWADDVKRERRETAAWHFVDIPWNATGFDEARDCYHPREGEPWTFNDHHNCVVDRIDMVEGILRGQNAARVDRIEALRFLVHLVADLHQPLHAIGEAHGGNAIEVIEFGTKDCGLRPCNFHAAWDFGLMKHAHLREQKYVTRLEQDIAEKQLARRPVGTPEAWANESFRLAHQVWLGNGGVIDQAYYLRNLPVLNEQLELAGLRLAALLNDVLQERKSTTPALPRHHARKR